MNSATTLGLAGIVVAGVVGPAVTGWLAIRRQVDQQDHERSRDDLADLRTLLAEAGKELQQAEGMTSAMKVYLLEHGRQVNDIAPSKEAVERFKEAAREVVYNDAQISIRLDDDDPVAKAHHDARLSIEQTANALLAVGRLEGTEPRWAHEEMTAGQERLRAARSEFSRAARAKVGTALPTRGSTRRLRWPGRLRARSSSG